MAAVVAVARKLIPEKIRSLEPQYLILFGGLGLILAFLVIAPLAILLFYSLWSVGPADMEPGSFTLEHYRKAFLDESTYSLLLNTAVFGIGSVIFGLILGVSLAWVVELSLIHI